MTCDERQAEISALLDGALPDDAAGDLFGHMSRCGACRRFHAATAAVREAVRHEETAPFPHELDRRIGTELRRVRPVQPPDGESIVDRLRRMLSTAFRMPAPAAIATLLLALLLGVLAARTVLAPQPQERHTVVVFPTVEVAASLRGTTGI